MHAFLPDCSVFTLSDMSYGSATPRILALNPLLSYTGRPPVYFNVSQHIQHIRLSYGCSPALLQAHALNHPSTQLHIHFPAFPHWPVEVTTYSRGVTVYDVLVRIHETLDRSVSPQEASVSPQLTCRCSFPLSRFDHMPFIVPFPIPPSSLRTQPADPVSSDFE